MNKNTLARFGLPVAAVVASIGLGFAGISAAETGTATGATGVVQKVRGMMGMGQRPGVMGKVTAISGNTLTVTETHPRDNTTTTYSVDVSKATFKKTSNGAAPVTSLLSDIAVGDAVAIRGTISGTNVTATDVLDGVAQMGMRRGGMERGPGGGVMGTVTAVNGNTVTLTGKDGKTYTVDAASADISKTSTITVSQIVVGDKIGVQGAVSGTTVTAKHIMDGVPPMHENDGTNK